MKQLAGMSGRFCLVCACVVVLKAEWSAGSSLPREEGAIYLEDLGVAPLRLEVLPNAHAYYDIHLSRYLGTLRRPQRVEVLAVADHALRVRGNAQQGQVAGWVKMDAVGPLDRALMDSLKAAAKRKAQVEKLIAAKEVAVGMTEDEVLRSVGRPEKKSSRVDASGRADLWEYITFKLVPQTRTVFDQWNRPYNETYYVKVPDGRMAVEFLDGIVTSVERSEGTLLQRGATIVTPPIELY